MKKIIALAVAGAFVAPVYAADVTVSGDLEYFYYNEDGGSASLQGGSQIITFKATSELDNGMTVSGSMNILTNGETEANDGSTAIVDSDGGENITVSGAFGSVAVGDVSSALDNVGDYTDIAPHDGGFAADGDDGSILFVLPTLVEGVKVSASHTPESTADNFAGNTSGDAFSVAYNFGAGEVYYGSQSRASETDMTAYGVKYTFGPMTVAYESGDSDTDQEHTGVALTYSMGATSVLFESQESDDGGTITVDDTIIAVKHNLGGGLTVYAQSTQEDQASSPVDKTYVGVNYVF
jgi:hypothetical protein